MYITFITGGARSGKSAYALAQAQKLSGKKAFIATAQALDDEMQARIKMHKKQRSNVWDTYEEPMEPARLIEELKSRYDVLLIDCLTLWLSNIMYAEMDVMKEIEKFAGCLITQGKEQPTIFIVSNEVGMGIVPENKFARIFRDYQGLLNQHIAGIADEVYMLVAGIPLKIK